MEWSYTSIIRQTKRNAATLGVCMVVLGPLWGPQWPWVCNMPVLDIDEVGKNKKPFYLRIFLWEGHILALLGKQSKMQQPYGYLWLFWGRRGGSYGRGCVICPS